MKISDLLRKEYIIEELRSATKRDVLGELSGAFLADAPPEEREAVVDILLDREKLGSTGIGEGIAIPHGKIGTLEQMVVTFGRSTKGIDFNAMDGKAAHLFFLLLAPESSAGQHLKVLAKISRMLKDTAFRRSLMDAKTKDDLFRVISDKDDAS